MAFRKGKGNHVNHCLLINDFLIYHPNRGYLIQTFLAQANPDL